jgi:hypothetical protein
MPDAARTLAVDGCADREPKRCARCRNPKPRDEFGRNASNPDGYSRYCLWCKRMLSYVDYHEGGGKEAKAAATAPPDVRARRLERDARWRAGRREQRRASSAAYARTPNGRLHKQRSNTLCILRRATDPEKVARLEARIALFDAEIARLAAREDELPAGPPKSRKTSAGPPKPRPRAAYGSRSVARGIHVTREGTFKVKVSDGKGSAIQGGTFKTRDEARIAANALGLQLLGIEGYADVPARGRAKP